MHDMGDKKTRQIVFRTTDEIANALDALAKFEDRTVAWLVNRALQDWLAWRSDSGYDEPPGTTMKSEGMDVLRWWASAGPTQRKIMRELMQKGVLEVREDDVPKKLNEPKGG